MIMEHLKNIENAFDALISEFEKLISQLNEDIKASLEKLEYLQLEILSKNAKEINEFLIKLQKNKKEWNSISSKIAASKNIKKGKIIREKLKRGLRTPESAYYKPIIESLFELGGRAKVEDVLKIVKDKMKNILNKYDWMALPSMPKAPRWKNTAQWARNKLVKQGYLSSNSPQGIWELEEKAKEFLKK